MKQLALILVILTFTSCYTAKVAQKQVARAHVSYPEVTSGFCAETFPVEETVKETIKLIPGAEIIKYDTITVDCDKVVSDTLPDNNVKIKYKTIIRTDTIVKTKEILQENTAKVTQLELQLKASENKLIRSSEALTSETKKKRQYRNGLFFLVAILALGVYFRVR